MSESAVDELERLADEFQPNAPEQRHLRLFTGRDFELYAESGDWEQQTRELEEKRENAIREGCQSDPALALLGGDLRGRASQRSGGAWRCWASDHPRLQTNLLLLKEH
jgi:hypothetical protein